MRGVAVALLVLVAVSPRAFGETPGTDLPGAVCVEGGRTPPDVAEPWLDVVPDRDPDPALAGFAELLRFRVHPSRAEGRALVVRLAGSAGEDPLFRGEKRTWAVVVDLGVGDVVVAYSYVEPVRHDDVWVYRPRQRSFTRTTREPLRGASPAARLCHALGIAGLASEVEILARTSGRVEADRALRRALDPNRSRCR